jgi:hypothetical protein
MKIYKLDTDVYNLNIKSDFFEVIESGVDRLWELFSLYNQSRLKENYSKESFDRLIIEKRFSYGAVVTYINDKPSLFFGLRKINDWIVVTRGVELFHFNYNLPIFLGHSLPFTIEHAKKNNISGVIMTFNMNNKKLFEMTHPQKTNKSIYSDHPIYLKYLETINSLESINHTVWYQNTEQYVRYMPLNADSFPWEYFKNEKP